jgi:hypothetical protein
MILIMFRSVILQPFTGEFLHIDFSPFRPPAPLKGGISNIYEKIFNTTGVEVREVTEYTPL